jgi:hypothetical protein
MNVRNWSEKFSGHLTESINCVHSWFKVDGSNEPTLDAQYKWSVNTIYRAKLLIYMLAKIIKTFIRITLADIFKDKLAP